MSQRLILAIATAFLAAGCATPSGVPVTLDQMLKGLETDLRNLGHLSIADFLSERPEDRTVAENYIRKRQNLYCQRNPLLVLALTSTFKMTLKGSITENGSFKITGIPVPTGEISAGQSKLAEQSLEAPTQITSLSALPDFYLNAKAMLYKDLEAEQKTKLMKTVIPEYERLVARVKEVEDSFDLSRCTNKLE